MVSGLSASLTPRGIDPMKRFSAALLLALAMASVPVAARDVVDASAASDVSVTIYRDPDGGELDRNDPRGFAMISETRTVTLPPGESTIRFEGVAEGMIAVSAIVTGLPGGTIEKNRNADLLSPAALVDGTLGNRVRITRTNPATGREEIERAIIRTRADGGIVLQTADGFEAVRCSGLPERLTFDNVPAGLSAQPVFSIDTRDETGGTYTVSLTYLAWGFDWQAHYVATLKNGGSNGRRQMRMLSWLTLVNDNGQSFDDAELLVVAGTLNVESDYEDLAEPPSGEPLRLNCWPIGSTAAGSPIMQYLPSPPAPNALGYREEAIMVTAAKRGVAFESMADVAMIADEENLGDLKLFRVPERVSVNAKGLKQVAFLNKDDVRGELIYELGCEPYRRPGDSPNYRPANIRFLTENGEKHGLGVALPRGGVTVFEPSSSGDLLIGEDGIPDYAVGQEVEIGLGQSTKVFGQCAFSGEEEPAGPDKNNWRQMRAVISNSGAERAQLRLAIGFASDWEVRPISGLKLRDGMQTIELAVKPGSEREVTFWMRPL